MDRRIAIVALVLGLLLILVSFLFFSSRNAIK